MGGALFATVRSSLDCDRCDFIFSKRQRGNYSAIDASEGTSLSITNCLFDRCGGEDFSPSIGIIYDAQDVDLKLIWNKFRNWRRQLCSGHMYIPPVGDQHSHPIEVNESAIIQN